MSFVLPRLALVVPLVTGSCGLDYQPPASRGRTLGSATGRTMVRMCSNPACGKPFHYLHQGRLFRLEPDPAFVHQPELHLDGSAVEYFWLCEVCCTTMTLRLDSRGAIVVEQAVRPAHRSARDIAVISQHNGMLLRTVAIASRKPVESFRPNRRAGR